MYSTTTTSFKDDEDDYDKWCNSIVPSSKNGIILSSAEYDEMMFPEPVRDDKISPDLLSSKEFHAKEPREPVVEKYDEYEDAYTNSDISYMYRFGFIMRTEIFDKKNRDNYMSFFERRLIRITQSIMEKQKSIDA